MAVVNFSEIVSFKTGDTVNTGLMATSLTAAYGISEGTANLNIGEPEETDVFVEESKVAYASIEGKRESDLTVELIGVEAQALAPLLGATYTAANATDPEKMSFPPSSQSVMKAIELSGKNSDGKDVVISFPKAKIISSTSGTVGRGQVRGWQIKCKILTPVNTSGAAQNWMIYETGSPTT
jgi:hypothetical protein